MKLRRTTWIMVALAAFLLGLVAARKLPLIDTSWIAALVILALALYRKPLIRNILLILIVFSLGVMRGGQFKQRLAPLDQLYGRKVIVIGTVDTDVVYGNNAQLSFDMGNLAFNEPRSTNVPGKLKIQGYGEPAIFRGDQVQVEGKLFQTRGSRQGSISYAELAVLSRSGSPVEAFRRRFVAAMQSALPEPHASFGLGLLIGLKATLPDTLSEQLSVVGLTHVVVASGYNLMIIIRASRKSLGKLSKYQSLIASLMLITVFLLITGLSPSIVRAAIVTTLGLGAWYYGRTFRPVLLILLAAALTAGWHPIYIWSDIGWYLSFLAFYGVLVLAPLVKNRLFAGKKLKFLATVTLESTCAQIMVAPLIMFIFKEVSVISLLANVLIVPLVPLAMLLSLGAGLGGMLLPAAVAWLAWPASILLTFMLDLINVLARVPNALKQTSVSLAQLTGLYMGVLAMSFILWHKTRGQGAKITPSELIEEV